MLFKEAAGVLIPLGLGGLRQLPQQGVGLIGEEFGMGLQDAAGVVPGAGLDEGEEGLQQLSGVIVLRFFAKQTVKLGFLLNVGRP